MDKVLATLEAEAGGRPLVLKNPRISLALPAWVPALDSRFAFVLVDRSPMDVALSVRRRDGRPLYVALALWQLYWAELLDGLAGRRVLVVRYENFVADPVGQGQPCWSGWPSGPASTRPTRLKRRVSFRPTCATITPGPPARPTWRC